MPYSTFSELMNGVITYLDRPDLEGDVGTFVALAEKRLTRRLNLAENESQAVLELVEGRSPLPNDYGSWRALHGPGRYPMEYAPPHIFLTRYGRDVGLQGDGYDDVAYPPSLGGGRPRWFTIVGSTDLSDIDTSIAAWGGALDNPFLLVGPTYTGQLTLLYRQTIPPLSDDNPENWLLAQHPDLYLYATLLETAPFLRDDARLAMWKAMLDEAVSGVTTLDREARWGRSRMVMAGPTP